VNIARPLFFFLTFVAVNSGLALTSTTVLPAGINSPSFRFGTIQGVDQKYTEDGTLMKLGDYKSVSFDAAQLSKFNPDAKKLIDALNHFGAQNLGDSFNLGVLKVDTSPQVNYFAPVFARGINAQWTLGVGVPIVNYKNKITFTQQFSNIDYYRQQFSGISPELDAALNTNLGEATNQTLIGKGYKPLGNRDETFVADIQLVSIYRFFEDPNQALTFQAQLALPTGPKYDTNDLAAVNIFGRTNVTNTLAYSRRLSSRWSAVPYVSYLLNIQDSVDMRVPENENDTLPDSSTQENVQRKIGNTSTVGGNLIYEYTDALSFGGGYEISDKDQDVYRGGRNQRYDLLAIDTAAKFQRLKAALSYSSVAAYFKKSAALPMILSYEVSDIIAGVNTERQLINELNVMLFF
jgi:hypothetical protein